MVKRRPRSDEELRAAAAHVRYELNMLDCSSFYIPIGISSPAVDETKNLALEAFLLHYRNLRAFFCPSLQSIRSDDVIASDYLSKAAPEDIGDARDLSLDKTRIDKLLAHISYERARYDATGEKNWNPVVMVQRIQKALAEFLRRLPAERHKWFEGSD